MKPITRGMLIGVAIAASTWGTARPPFPGQSTDLDSFDLTGSTLIQSDVSRRGQMPLVLPNPSYIGVVEAALADFECRLKNRFSDPVLTVTRAKKPQILSLLPCSDTFIYVLDEKQAADAGFLGLGGSGSRSYSVIVQEYSLYRPFYFVSGSDTLAYRYGVGLRLVVEVNEKKGSISALSIPGITAKVEAGKLRASIRMQVFGISGKNITSAFPMPVELNFTTLRQMYEGIDKIKASIYADRDNEIFVEPQVLSGPVVNPTGPTASRVPKQ